MITGAERGITPNIAEASANGNGILSQSQTELFTARWKLVDFALAIPVCEVDTGKKYDEGTNYATTLEFINTVLEAERKERKSGKEIIRATHPRVAQLVDRAGRADALELIYKPPSESDSDLLQIWNIVVNGLHSVQGIRWRLDALKQEMGTAARVLLNQGQENIKILSIASGFAEAPLQVISQIESIEPGRARGVFIDEDEKAITESKERARVLGTEDRIEFHNCQFQHFEFHTQNAQIIEISGVLDYLNNTRAKKLLVQARQALSKNGIVFVGNMLPVGKEQEYVRTGWRRMYHRTVEELAKIAMESRFDPAKSCIIINSTRTVGILIARE